MSIDSKGNKTARPGSSFDQPITGIGPEPAASAAVGDEISDEGLAELQSQGWYLQILPTAPTTRTGRGSPPMTLWYMDGGSIQRIRVVPS